MASSNKVRNGNDLMVFIDGKSVAFATNHQLSLTQETDTVQSKDNGYNGVTLAKNITWEITSENLYVDAEFERLFDKMYSTDKYVTLVWGVAADTSAGKTTQTGFASTDAFDSSKYWSNDTSTTYYTGSALISSLSLTAGAGDNATYSVTFTGSGDFSKHS